MGVLSREEAKFLDRAGVHNGFPFTSALTGSTVVGASAWDDRYRGWGGDL